MLCRTREHYPYLPYLPLYYWALNYYSPTTLPDCFTHRAVRTLATVVTHPDLFSTSLALFRTPPHTGDATV